MADMEAQERHRAAVPGTHLLNAHPTSCLALLMKLCPHHFYHKTGACVQEASM